MSFHITNAQHESFHSETTRFFAPSRPGTAGTETREILATVRMVKSRIVLNLDDDFIASLTNCVAWLVSQVLR